MLERWRALVIQSVCFKWVEFMLQIPLQDQLERWIKHFMPGRIGGFRAHFGMHVAVDKGRAHVDLARMLGIPMAYQDVDAERAFPSIERPLVLFTEVGGGQREFRWSNEEK